MIRSSADTEATARHTPAPWVVDLDREFIQDGDQVSVEALTPDGMVAREVCSLFLDTGENKDGDDYAEDAANARLIAAAPELLEALKGIMAQFDAGYFVRNIEGDGQPDWAIKAARSVQALSVAVKAIAKAEGR